MRISNDKYMTIFLKLLFIGQNGHGQVAIVDHDGAGLDWGFYDLKELMEVYLWCLEYLWGCIGMRVAV